MFCLTLFSRPKFRFRFIYHLLYERSQNPFAVFRAFYVNAALRRLRDGFLSLVSNLGGLPRSVRLHVLDGWLMAQGPCAGQAHTNKSPPGGCPTVPGLSESRCW